MARSSPDDPTGSRYLCPQCTRSYRRSEHLMRHLRSTHGQGSETFPCPHCPSKFTRRDVMRKHVQSLHAGNDERASQGRQAAACESCSKRKVKCSQRHRQGDEPAGPCILCETRQWRCSLVSETSALTASPQSAEVSSTPTLPQLNVASGHEHGHGLDNTDLSSSMLLAPNQQSPLDDFGSLGWMFDIQAPTDLTWLNAWQASAPTLPAASSLRSLIVPPLPPPPPLFEQHHYQPQIRASRRGSPVIHDSDWPEDYEPQNERGAQVDLGHFILTRQGTTAFSDRPLNSPGSVSEETRTVLLDFIATTGMHQWSPYCLPSNPPRNFLTTGELSALVGMYFDRLHPHIPFIHAPTFDSAATHPLLLLSVIAIALPYIGEHPQVDKVAACKLSAALADLVRIGIVTASETGKNTLGDYSSMLLILAQSWLHQQTLGLGCGDKRMYQFAERNRGGLITFARRSGLLRSRHGTRAASTDNEEAWRRWIRKEAEIRLAWSIFVYDQQICILLDSAPMLTPSEMRAELPHRDRLWTAKNAKEWADGLSSLTAEDVQPLWLQPTIQNLLSRQMSVEMTGDATSPPPNRFASVILSSVLYRLLWDTTKTRRFLVGDDEHGAKGAQGMLLAFAAGDDHLPSILQSAIAVLSTRASMGRPSSFSPRHPLSADAHLLHHICTVHFGAGPAFIEHCVAAAGRYGLKTEYCTDARKKLQQRIQRPRLQGRKVRSAVAGAAQVVACAMDYESRERDTLLMVFGLFHAALVLWAYARYQVNTGNSDDAFALDNAEGAVPLASTQAVTLAQANGVDLTAVHASQKLGSQLWVEGRYRCADDGQSCVCEFRPRRVSLGSIALLENMQDDNGPSEATKILKHVSLLLDTLPWGLASSFAAVLNRVADSGE